MEFKEEAVKLVTEQGYTPTEVAKTLGIDRKNVNRWIDFKKQKISNKSVTLEQEEIKRLRKENERLKMEREILKKATAFFASEKI